MFTGRGTLSTGVEGPQGEKCLISETKHQLFLGIPAIILLRILAAAQEVAQSLETRKEQHVNCKVLVRSATASTAVAV